VVPVAQRATHHLIRQLDLVEAGDPIEDAAMEKFSEMFQGPLEPKAIAALRAAARLDNGRLTEAAAALATDELAA
jgi:hypothetical protein